MNKTEWSIRSLTSKWAWKALLSGALVSVGCGNDNDGFNGVILPPTATVTTSGSVTGGPTLAPPVAVNDSYNVVGNGTLTVAAPGVLANDQANPGPGATAAAVLQNRPTQGQLALNPDGSFTYTPNQGVGNTTDTFTYTLTNSSGTATGTVTINIGSLAFFVNNQAAAGGNGQQSTPFRTLNDAVTAANNVTGAQIVVARGDGTSTGYAGAVTLGANQTLRGADPTNPPLLTGPVNVASGDTVSDLQLRGSAADAVTGTNVVRLTLQNLVVSGTASNGVNLTNPNGTVTMTGLTFSNIGGTAARTPVSSGTLNLTASNWTVDTTSTDASSVTVSGTAVVNGTYDQMNFKNIGATNAIQTNSRYGFFWRTQNSSNATLRVSNYTFNTGGDGVRTDSDNNSTLNVVVSSANISNCINLGIFVQGFTDSMLKNRVTNSRLLGNSAGYEADSSAVSGTATTCVRLLGNVSDSYNFLQGGTAVLSVENLAGVSTENTGTSVPSGAVQDVPVDSCDIPQ